MILFQQKCPVCGCVSNFISENVYTVYIPNGIASLLKKPDMYDVVDCPVCKCQILLKERLPGVENDAEEPGSK